jgi:hypothetical protein
MTICAKSEAQRASGLSYLYSQLFAYCGRGRRAYLRRVLEGGRRQLSLCETAVVCPPVARRPPPAARRPPPVCLDCRRPDKRKKCQDAANDGRPSSIRKLQLAIARFKSNPHESYSLCMQKQCEMWVKVYLLLLIRISLATLD